MDSRLVLEKYFGYTIFRPGQQAIIDSILSRQDTLAILPTGGGKSLCFQIPGLMLEGTTLVVSPLISLMKDQVDSLLSKNITSTYINSSLETKEIKHRFGQLAARKYQFVYIAPERLQTTQFIKVCQQINIPLIAIDEAHCISMWGHDFRPEYTQINQFIKQLTTLPTVAAFTATATNKVRTDIITSLELSQPQIFLNSFKRENLSFHVAVCLDNFSQELALFIILKKHSHQAGIIYTTTQKKAEYLSSLIKHYYGNDFPVDAYHAGLENNHRANVQEKFLANQLQIITATNAFGMGVDKPNVRWVIHYQIPGNLENYYQEAGRAGRDQQPADCYLLFNPADIKIQKIFIDKSHPQKDDPLRTHQLNQLQQMIVYAQTSACRQTTILNYFNEAANNCDQCDNCQNNQLQLSLTDQQYHRLLSSIKHQLPPRVFTPKLLLLFCIHRPDSKSDFLKIPGIGYGWVEKWYNQVLKLLEKENTYVHDPQTTHHGISKNC
jgi:ATP-dependent DNA helicase RecQ